MANKLLHYLIVIMLLFPLSGKAQERQEINQFIIDLHSSGWYSEQADLWQKRIASEPDDANAWMNYYKARRFQLISQNPEIWNRSPKSLISGLDSILLEMRQAVPNTFEYHYLRWYHLMDTDAAIANLKEAYRINSDRVEIFPGMIDLYSIQGNNEGVSEIAKRWYAEKNYPLDVMAFNYNILMSVDSGAILFTYSDNGYYPIVLLQEAENVRTDVTMINLNLAGNRDYLSNKLIHLDPGLDINLLSIGKPKERLLKLVHSLSERLPSTSVFIPVNLPEDMLFGELGNDLYIEGLAFRYSRTGYDNLGKLLRNFEDRFVTDHLDKKFYRKKSELLSNKINAYYLFPLINLYKAYYFEGMDEKRRITEHLILTIAQKSGLQNHIKDMLKLAVEQ